MNICRICLSTEISKSLKHIETADKSGSKNFVQVMLFCFGIQVPEHSTVSNGLCMKCFKKITSYYKFKTLALSSDAYLRSLEPQIRIKNEVLIEDDDDHDIFNNNDFNDELSIDVDVKPGEIKLENLNFDSDDDDDELLSVIKKCKEEVPEDIKEVLPEDTIIDPIKKVPRKRVRGEKAPRIKRDKTKKYDKKKYPKTKKGVCEACGKFVMDLTSHARTHIPKEMRKKLKCKFCDKEFLDYGARYKHTRVIHKGLKKHCDECGKDVVCLRSHKLRVHHKELLQFICAICNQPHLTQNLLDIHMMIHTKDKPVECDVCHARFRLRPMMIRHKREVHDKEKPHMCQYCPKAYFKKDALKEHLRVHTNERPYKCENCGETFRTRQTLRNHSTIHSDVKPFPCPYCDMRFSRNTYLYIHKRTHTKEKNYPCKYCGISFRRSDHRTRHEFTAHEKFNGQERRKGKIDLATEVEVNEKTQLSVEVETV